MSNKKRRSEIGISILEHNSNCKLLSFPDHILLHIFQYLDTVSLVKLALVSKRCYHVTADASLTKFIDLRSHPLCLRNLWKVLNRRLAAVTLSFNVRGITQVHSVMEKLTVPFLNRLSDKCPRLNSLSLERFDLREVPLTALNQNLTSLSLKESMLSMGWFDDLKNGYSMPNLKHLNLHSCSKISNNDLQTVSNLQNVETLILCNCFRISARGIPNIQAHMKKLTHVDFSGCPGINNVALHYMGKLPLKHLALRFCHLITTHGIKLLFSLHIGDTLEVLDIYSCHEVTDDALDIIAANATCLHRLDLSRCNKLTVDKVDDLKKNLPKCHVFFELVTETSECSETNYQACARM